MLPNEREMIRKPDPVEPSPDRFTSLQPTYEDTIPTDPEDDWELDD